MGRGGGRRVNLRLRGVAQIRSREGVPHAAPGAVKGLAMLVSDPIVLCVGACFPSGNDGERAVSLLNEEGIRVLPARSQDVAATLLCYVAPAVVVIDLGLADGSPLAVADFCSYRRPEARVILSGCGGLMVDGAIFRHVTNAAALVPGSMAPDDLCALIAYHADRGCSRPSAILPRPRTATELRGRVIPIGRPVEEAMAV